MNPDSLRAAVVCIVGVPRAEQISNLPLSYVRPLGATDPCSPKRPADASIGLMLFSPRGVGIGHCVKRMTQAYLNRSHGLSAGALHRGLLWASRGRFTSVHSSFSDNEFRGAAGYHSQRSVRSSFGPAGLSAKDLCPPPIDTNFSQHEGAVICASGLAFAPWVV